MGVARIELATPAMSTQCSTTELHAHSTRLYGGWARLARCLAIDSSKVRPGRVARGGVGRKA